jgi:hypothetical protein
MKPKFVRLCVFLVAFITALFSGCSASSPSGDATGNQTPVSNPSDAANEAMFAWEEELSRLAALLGDSVTWGEVREGASSEIVRAGDWVHNGDFVCSFTAWHDGSGKARISVLPSAEQRYNNATFVCFSRVIAAFGADGLSEDGKSIAIPSDLGDGVSALQLTVLAQMKPSVSYGSEKLFPWFNSGHKYIVGYSATGCFMEVGPTYG